VKILLVTEAGAGFDIFTASLAVWLFVRGE